MSLDKDEKLIQELLAKSDRKMPFADFEERLMLRIHEEQLYSHSFSKDVKLSWLFFVVGTLFGLFLNVIVAEMNRSFFGLPAQKWVLVIQSIFVIFMLFQFDKLVGLTKNATRSYVNSGKEDII